MDGRGKEILEQLLRERTPEERRRLSAAWERAAGGDPDSLPALFALSDRFSLEAHAAMLAEMVRMRADLEHMAREIGRGAGATVARAEAAAAAAGERAARFESLIPAVEGMVREQREEGLALLARAEESARSISRELGEARRTQERLLSGGMVVFSAVLTTIAMGLGFWAGGELRALREPAPEHRPLPPRGPEGQTH